MVLRAVFWHIIFIVYPPTQFSALSGTGESRLLFLGNVCWRMEKNSPERRFLSGSVLLAQLILSLHSIQISKTEALVSIAPSFLSLQARKLYSFFFVSLQLFSISAFRSEKRTGFCFPLFVCFCLFLLLLISGERDGDFLVQVSKKRRRKKEGWESFILSLQNLCSLLPVLIFFVLLPFFCYSA